MGIGIYYDKLDNGAKAFLEKHHKVPGAVHFAKAPIVEENTVFDLEGVSTFTGFGGEMAVGDPDAFKAFSRLAEQRNLQPEQMPKGYEFPAQDSEVKNVTLPTHDIPVVPLDCQVAPEMSC